MDQYGQIGPEKDDYADDVRNVARGLCGATVYVKLADQGTRYNILLTSKADLGGPGGYPDGLDEEGEYVSTGRWVHVAVTEHGAYWFNVQAYNAPGYIATKLGLTPTDGEVIGEFLTRLRHELNRPAEMR